MLSAADARRLGASDFPALLGLSPWSGPVALWARMVHGWQGEQTSDMAAGHAAEQYTRALYKGRTGYELTGPAKWTHPLYPWLRCSPDDCALAPDGRRLVELKRYNDLSGWGAEGSEDVPRDIWIQVQVQAGVGLDNGQTDAAGVDVAALLRGELRVYSVPHRPEVYERCIALGERFVRDFVQTGRYPEGMALTLLERDAEALAACFPAPKSEAAPLAWEALSAEQRSTVRRWLNANAARKAWEKEENYLAVKVREMLREVPGLTLPGEEGRIDFTPNAPTARLNMTAVRAALDSEDPAFARRMRELMQKHTKHESSRPLVARWRQG